MSKLKLQATDGSAGTVSLKAPASTTGNAEFELPLPGSAGSNGQLLSTNGSGVLTWTDDATAPEGTAVKSTGVTGTTKYLRADGDNTCSWQTVTSVGGATGVDFNDNVKSRFGTGNDLEIYHDGTDSLVKNETNDLILQSTGDDVIIKGNDDVLLYVQGGAENAVFCRNNGQVELYYDGTKKFETTSTGVWVTGNTTVTGDLLLDEGDDKRIRLGDSQDLQIYHDGSNSFLTNATGTLKVRADTVNFEDKDSTIFYQKFNDGTGVEQYYAGTKRLETTSTGIQVSGSGPTTTIDSFDDLMAASAITIYSTNDTAGSQSGITFAGADHTTDGCNAGIIAKHENVTENSEDTSLAFYVSDAETITEALTLSHDGNLTVHRIQGSNKGFHVKHGSNVCASLNQNGTGPEGVLQLFNAGTQKILCNGDNGTYYGVNTTIQALSSERRTKENITSIDDTKSWSTLKDIKLYSFSYKNDTNSDTHYGPIVDEVPTDMKVPTSNSDDVGVINTYNSELLLFRAYSTIKQLVAKVETLETKVAALEAG